MAVTEENKNVDELAISTSRYFHASYYCLAACRGV